MNRDKMIRNSLLKSLDPALYFQQDFFTTQAKTKRMECDITTTKPSTIILSRQSYLNSPENEKCYQSPKKIEKKKSPRSPKSGKKNHKRYLSLVSSSQKTNTLQASKQKFKRLGCSRRSHCKLVSKLELSPYLQESNGMKNRAQSCKVIGLKKQAYKSSILTPYTSRDKIVAQQKNTPNYSKDTKIQQGGRYSLRDTQRIVNIPQSSFPTSNYVNQQKQFIIINNNNNTRQQNPNSGHKISQSLNKSQSIQILQRVHPSISFSYSNKTLHQNGYNQEADTSRTVSTPIHMIQPTPKSERINHFIFPPQNIQYQPQFHPRQIISNQSLPQFHPQQIIANQNLPQFHPHQINPHQAPPFQNIPTFHNNPPIMIRNNQNYTCAYPINPVYRIVQSCQLVSPQQTNVVQQRGINNDQLVNLSREIGENDDRRKKAFDLIQRKLDELSSRTHSLNKTNPLFMNSQSTSTDQNLKKIMINQNQDFLNEMNQNLNNDKKIIIDRLDALIGKQNERQKIINSKSVGQVNLS